MLSKKKRGKKKKDPSGDLGGLSSVKVYFKKRGFQL